MRWDKLVTSNMKDMNATKCAKTKIGGTPVMAIALQ